MLRNILERRGQLVLAKNIKRVLLEDAERTACNDGLPWPWCELNAEEAANAIGAGKVDAAVDADAKRLGLLAVDEDSFARREHIRAARQEAGE